LPSRIEQFCLEAAIESIVYITPSTPLPFKDIKKIHYRRSLLQNQHKMRWQRCYRHGLNSRSFDGRRAPVRKCRAAPILSGRMLQSGRLN
jgi:hypothetical protein